MGRSRRTVQDVIEDLGFGWAQAVNLLAHGIWFVEAAQIQMAMSLGQATAQHLGMTSTQVASLSSVIFLGITIGSLLGGYLSDRFGRVQPVMLSYLLAIASQLLSSAVQTYGFLVAVRFAMGIGFGVGMPPSLAFVSETCPANKRVMMQGVRAVIYGLGNLFSAVALIVDNPATIIGLRWRTDLLLSGVAYSLLGLTARYCLHESAVFLAHCGKYTESQVSLAQMRRLNGLDGSHGGSRVDTEYEPPQGEAPEGGGRSQQSRVGWREEFKLIFGPRFLWTTVVLSTGSFAGNFILYGHMYAFPLILTETKSTMLPGYQALMQASIGMVTNLGVTAFAMATSCRSTLILAAVLGVMGPLLISWSALLQDRTAFQEVVYLVSQNVPGVAAASAFLASFQSSVDLYPTQVAATSAAVVVSCGRVAAIIAPFIASACNSIRSFYELMSVLGFFLLVLTLAAFTKSSATQAELTALVSAEKP